MTDRRIRLLVVSATLGAGGAERFASNFVAELDRQRFDLNLCLLRSEIDYPLAPGTPVEILGQNQPWQIPLAAARLRRLIGRLQPDVLLSVIGSASRATGLALRGLKHRPYWIARLGSNPERNDAWILKLLNRCCYPLADRFVANSQGLAAAVAQYYPFAADRIEVILNSADFVQLDRQAAETPTRLARPGVPVILTASRLIPLKRLEVLIESFALLRRSRSAELWICGVGPLRERLSQLIRDRGLSDSAHLLGFCKNPYALMRQASIFALSSETEGLPNCLIESQALGIPAVSTRCPHGPEEIVEHGRTGLLVDVGSVAQFHGALVELLSNESLRRTMGAAAAHRARTVFATPAIQSQWTEVLSAPFRTIRHGATRAA